MSALQRKSEELKKKIQMQNMVILALAIVIIVLIVVSSTAAWYIRTKSDSADIILSNPVNIYITEFDSKTADGKDYTGHKVQQDILESYNNRIFPGDRIKLNLGMQIGDEKESSSNAYVRVKLSMAFSKLSDNPYEEEKPLQELADDGLIEYEDKPDLRNWLLVDFNDPDGVHENDPTFDHDYWYVYKEKAVDGSDVSRVARDMEQIQFLNGYIKLSKTEITNKHANHKFHIVYTVEAIQVANVPDPIVQRGHGPWWNFVYGDEME